MQIVLASTSPFRQELLRKMGLPFLAVSPTFEEDTVKKDFLPPHQMAAHLAQKKGESVISQFPSSIIIASDQLVHLGAEIFSKAGTRERAIAQLSLLSGKTHEIETALWMYHPNKGTKACVVTAQMSMRSLTNHEIESYVDLEKPFGSAGSYKIEGAGIALFEMVETADFYSIIGLPLLSVVETLRSWELPLPFAWKT